MLFRSFSQHFYINPKDLPESSHKKIDIICDFCGEEFEEMSTDASTVGLTIKTISAYRSYEYQEKLYEQYLLNDPQEIVDTYNDLASGSGTNFNRCVLVSFLSFCKHK